ncbi:hypothetical protein B1B_10999, partial [mine drainage metagenome]
AQSPTLLPATVNGYLPPVQHGNGQLEYAPDLQVAYDEQSLFKNSGYPTNAVIATILSAGCTIYTSGICPNVTAGFDPSDVYAFFNETFPSDEPHPTVYGVPLQGAPPPGPSASYDVTGANVENTLDLEMVGSAAPGASIYNVYSSSSTVEGLDSAFAFILNPNASFSSLNQVSVISNSWATTDSNDSSWFQDLEEAQARGITV